MLIFVFLLLIIILIVFEELIRINRLELKMKIKKGQISQYDRRE